MSKTFDFEFDHLVVGSGFGGSVAAMRLSQKGYAVGVVEAGRRWHADEFPRRNWNLRKFLWLPSLGLYGIWRLRLLNGIFILAGSGVGGGSLNYGNTLYVPPDVFFERPSVRRLGGKPELLPYYQLAGRMLGVVENPVETAQDLLMKETAAEIGREGTYRPTPVGVYFGREGVPAADPYFEGEGPDRIGCELCGECMTGCRKDAKNSLDKNYLYFAEKFGARIFAENRVVDIEPLSPDGSEGYVVRTRKTTGLFRGRRGLTFKAKGLVLAAGTLGTNTLLLDMKRKDRLPRLSPHLGRYARTNSETLLGVRSFAPDADFTRGVAITSSVHPEPETHLEPVRFGKGHDAMCVLVAALTDGEKKVPRFLRWIGNELRHPLRHFRMRRPAGWARETVILLVMQTLDNYFHLVRRRPWAFPFVEVLASEHRHDQRHPKWLPVGNDFGRRLAQRTGGVAANVVTEVTANIPITAHILGGCSFGPTPEEGVIDEQNRVKGYANMIVCDGSQIPENLGVNPALSITAFAERAMSFIPAAKPVRVLAAEKTWGSDGLLLRGPVRPREPLSPAS
jgi:cholesterol oxidase